MEEEAEEEEAMVTATDRLAEFHKDAQSLPAPCAAARVGWPQRRECGLATPRFSLSEPPGSGEADFLRAEPRAPTLTMHYPCSEKPRIWSLAHTAAASAVEGAPPTPPKPRSPECHLIPRQPLGSGGRPAVPRDSACDEASRVAKAFGNPAFALQGLPLNCAPCPRRREPLVQSHYPSGAEGSVDPQQRWERLSKRHHLPTTVQPALYAPSLPLGHAQVKAWRETVPQNPLKWKLRDIVFLVPPRFEGKQ